jgi:hypothetical protein
MTFGFHTREDKGVKLLLQLITLKLDILMAKQEKFDALIARLDTTTNTMAESVLEIGADQKFLLDEIKRLNDGSVSDESLNKAEANIAKAEEIATALKGIGAQVDNPVPVPEPPVEGGTPA